MSKMLKYQCIEVGLIDVWRSKFPGSRDFTFCSNRHASYSRIDFFFTSKRELHRISDIKILPITLSDHAPIQLKWDIGHKPLTIKTELKNYIDTNDLPATSPLTLWDCAKAFLRGRIIAFACARRRQREAKQHELEDIIKVLEFKHKQSTSTSLLKELKATHRELDSLLSDKIEGNLRFTNQKYYEHGNRSSRLLAFRLRKQKSSNVVQKIKIKSQITFVTKPDKIAESFALFYESLYRNTDTCSEDKKIQIS